jgi:hypothetical protein
VAHVQAAPSPVGGNPVGERIVPGGSIISDGEGAVWTGGGRAAHYREKAAHFKELASVELQPRARAQLLGLAAEYDQLCRDEATGNKPEIADIAERISGRR